MREGRRENTRRVSPGLEVPGSPDDALSELLVMTCIDGFD